jgi:hypothetical protein
MSWIATATGGEFDVRRPRPGQVVFADVAHALAQINRFCGHARRPYSVAEHSLLVTEICEREFGMRVHGLLAALMHDAHEAYTGDMSSPVKQVVGDGWRRFESEMEYAVRRSFSLFYACSSHAHQVHQADLMALATERLQLMPPTATPWAALDGVQPVGWADLMESGRCGMTWLDWRQAFADKYHELEFARDALLDAMPKIEGANP